MSIAIQNMYNALRKPLSSENSNDFNTDIVAGKVTSVTPLKIIIESRPPLDESYLTLSPMCKELKLKATTKSNSGEYSHTHDIELLLWRGLEIGDVVNMIKMADNQKYYVTERRDMKLDTAT